VLRIDRVDGHFVAPTKGESNEMSVSSKQLTRPLIPKYVPRFKWNEALGRVSLTSAVEQGGVLLAVCSTGEPTKTNG
jgi:hypothetical protein